MLGPHSFWAHDSHLGALELCQCSPLARTFQRFWDSRLPEAGLGPPESQHTGSASWDRAQAYLAGACVTEAAWTLESSGCCSGQSSIKGRGEVGGGQQWEFPSLVTSLCKPVGLPSGAREQGVCPILWPELNNACYTNRGIHT